MNLRLIDDYHLHITPHLRGDCDTYHLWRVCPSQSPQRQLVVSDR